MPYLGVFEHVNRHFFGYGLQEKNVEKVRSNPGNTGRGMDPITRQHSQVAARMPTESTLAASAVSFTTKRYQRVDKS